MGCRKAYKQQYYQENKERYKQWRKQWYENNREHALALSSDWQKQNATQRRDTQKAWAKANPDKLHSYRLKTKYGISKETYDQLLQSQNSQCAICGTDEEPPRGWHVDHCHKTELVRGILCSHCNFLLGYAKDDTSILESAINYLRKTS
jgi:hypothetical protein